MEDAGSSDGPLLPSQNKAGWSRRRLFLRAGVLAAVAASAAVLLLLLVLLCGAMQSRDAAHALRPGFLDFERLPDTNFSCEGKVIGGYYADVETGCQMFHVCTLGQKGEVQDIKFLCLNGTVFDQQTRVCERVDEVDCHLAEQYYDLNLELFGPPNAPAHPSIADNEEEVQQHQYGVSSTSSTSTTPLPPPSSTARPAPRPSPHPTPHHPTYHPTHHPTPTPPRIFFPPTSPSLPPRTAPPLLYRPHPYELVLRQQRYNTSLQLGGGAGSSTTQLPPPKVENVSTTTPAQYNYDYYDYEYEYQGEAADADAKAEHQAHFQHSDVPRILTKGPYLPRVRRQADDQQTTRYVSPGQRVVFVRKGVRASSTTTTSTSTSTAAPRLVRTRTPGVSRRRTTSSVPTTPRATVSNSGSPPATTFTCAGRVSGGLYADVELGCRAFHICAQGKKGRLRKQSFWCGVGTLLDQRSRTCREQTAVRCQDAPSLYHLNERADPDVIAAGGEFPGGFEPLRLNRRFGRRRRAVEGLNKLSRWWRRRRGTAWLTDVVQEDDVVTGRRYRRQVTSPSALTGNRGGEATAALLRFFGLRQEDLAALHFDLASLDPAFVSAVLSRLSHAQTLAGNLERTLRSQPQGLTPQQQILLAAATGRAQDNNKQQGKGDNSNRVDKAIQASSHDDLQQNLESNSQEDSSSYEGEVGAEESINSNSADDRSGSSSVYSDSSEYYDSYEYDDDDYSDPFGVSRRKSKALGTSEERYDEPVSSSTVEATTYQEELEEATTIVNNAWEPAWTTNVITTDVTTEKEATTTVATTTTTSATTTEPYESTTPEISTTTASSIAQSPIGGFLITRLPPSTPMTPSTSPVPKKRRFTCRGRHMFRFYADTSLGCRLFHFCSPGFEPRQLLDFRFLCALGHRFSDLAQRCMPMPPVRRRASDLAVCS